MSLLAWMILAQISSLLCVYAFWNLPCRWLERLRCRMLGFEEPRERGRYEGYYDGR